MFCLENGKLMSIKHETVLNDIIHCPVKGGFHLFGVITYAWSWTNSGNYAETDFNEIER